MLKIKGKKTLKILRSIFFSVAEKGSFREAIVLLISQMNQMEIQCLLILLI